MERENSFYYYYCYYYRSVTDDGATDQSERSSETSDERHAEESDWRPGRPIRLNGVLDRRLLTVLGRKDHARGGFLFCFLLFFCCCFFYVEFYLRDFDWLYGGSIERESHFNSERKQKTLGRLWTFGRRIFTRHRPHFLSFFLSFSLNTPSSPPPCHNEKKTKKKTFFSIFFLIRGNSLVQCCIEDLNGDGWWGITRRYRQRFGIDGSTEISLKNPIECNMSYF